MSPMRSKAQNRAMHAAAQGQSNIGIPADVGQDFVAASHGQDVKGLPQKAKGKDSDDKPMKKKARPGRQFDLHKEGKGSRR